MREFLIDNFELSQSDLTRLLKLNPLTGNTLHTSQTT